jgi:hypothetical protein
MGEEKESLAMLEARQKLDGSKKERGWTRPLV